MQTLSAVIFSDYFSMQLAMSLEQTQQPKVDQDWEDIKKQLGDTSGLTE